MCLKLASKLRTGTDAMYRWEKGNVRVLFEMRPQLADIWFCDAAREWNKLGVGTFSLLDHLLDHSTLVLRQGNQVSRLWLRPITTSSLSSSSSAGIAIYCSEKFSCTSQGPTKPTPALVIFWRSQSRRWKKEVPSRRLQFVHSSHSSSSKAKASKGNTASSGSQFESVHNLHMGILPSCNNLNLNHPEEADTCLNPRRLRIFLEGDLEESQCR
ncbi:hypothetical protein BT96DRAFT_973827 [Gymnopus androsaceus JB14]|uniref:Uncharacterized protein n=1 Tax=Gymnopus androsaceus JB14 TaxID=1447944 RepID=A0A6A4I357_9AGAR|nr:hypothetical protein BT96DRAFT_973827 [Gymnopus androsaceus JB14]